MTEYVETAEVKAYRAFLDEKRSEITEAARELVEIAQNFAYGVHLVRSYCAQPFEFYMADHNMLDRALMLTEHDREVLAEVAQAAKAASESLDKDDFEALASFRIWAGDLHRYYAMISKMVENALKPTDSRAISSAQMDLWIDYGDRWAHNGAEAECRPTQQRSDDSQWEVSF